MKNLMVGSSALGMLAFVGATVLQAQQDDVHHILQDNQTTTGPPRPNPPAGLDGRALESTTLVPESQHGSAAHQNQSTTRQHDRTRAKAPGQNGSTGGGPAMNRMPSPQHGTMDGPPSGRAREEGIAGPPMGAGGGPPMGAGGGPPMEASAQDLRPRSKTTRSPTPSGKAPSSMHVPDGRSTLPNTERQPDLSHEDAHP